MKTNKTLTTTQDLIEHQLIQQTDVTAINEAMDHFSLRITPAMVSRMGTDPKNPVALQFVPSKKELNTSPVEKEDPIGDQVHGKVKGIIHRYPDRCLFAPVHVCPVYCRFCFRKNKVGSAGQTLTPSEMQNAFNYIAQHQEIWEVILTGGDPFILKPASLKRILFALNQIKHVEVIRIHTRVPVVAAEKINAALINALISNKAVYVVLHANHADEFTQEAIKACATIVDAGIPMLSQTTLLKSVNDNIEALSTLMRCFVRHRIKPYYLHHPDLVKGTRHFRVSIARGRALMKELRGRFSGLCQPTYVLDIPGGFGKVPIGPHYMTAQGEAYDLIDYLGAHHCYQDDIEPA